MATTAAAPQRGGVQAATIAALHEASMDSEWTRPLWVIAETIRDLQVG